MTHELIINVEQNITLKIRENFQVTNFDCYWICSLNASTILYGVPVILTIILASILCTLTKQSHLNLTILIRLLAIASFSDCILGRTFSLIFAIFYITEPPHQILCRLSAASSLFAVILESICIGSVAITKLVRNVFRLWLILIIAVIFVLPILVMSSYISVGYFSQRYKCEIVGDMNLYYSITVFVLVYAPSWFAMLYFCFNYTFLLFPTSNNKINELKNKDNKFLVLLIYLYIMLVVPRVIYRNERIISWYISNNSEDSSQFDDITSGLMVLFYLLWPFLILMMYPSIYNSAKSLILECRTKKTNYNCITNNISDDSLTPVLLATNNGLFLQGVQGLKRVDLTLLNDTSTNQLSQSSIKPENSQSQNKKVVRFASQVIQLPEISVSNTTYPSSSTSSV